MGYFISPNGTIMHPDKVNVINNFTKPQNKKDLQFFFDFCCMYCKFSQNYSQLLYPLSYFIKDNKTNCTFHINEKEIFKKIIKAFSKTVPPTLISHSVYIMMCFFIGLDIKRF